ncbi:hypothetical protein DRB96_21930 [Streptomyces sp. ICC1]|nr:hypothetical protein DRB89_22020 [Streptomyces sp. ICC4]AWZ18155.1 hypothetical protein DRB96_21930 [Streptomyces sp. ICC1]
MWQQVPQRDPFPRADAVTVAGCADCSELIALRSAARKILDASTATDCNIRIRLHSEEHGRKAQA